MNCIKNMKVISSLEKLYDTDSIPEKSLSAFSMLKNEKKSFQLAVESTEEHEASLTVTSGLKDIRIYTVEHIKSDFPMDKKDADDYFRFSESGYYPDLLLPAKEKFTLKKGITVLWFEVNASLNTAGSHTVELTLGDKSATVNIEIIDAELDFNNFVYTNWFHTDCLMSHYNFDAFSEEYWRVTENFLQTAADYGMTCVLTPLFTPALDTQIGGERPTVQLVDVTVNNGAYSFNFDKLTRWIEMAHRCGIKYFEFSHFYTQWGARRTPKIMATVDGEYKRIFGWDTRANSKKYRTFLKSFSVQLKSYVEKRGLKNNVLIHVSDEPNFSMPLSYGRAAKYIRSLFNGYRIVDALSDFRFYKLGIVPNPIPATDHIDSFIGKVDDLWTYYCSGQRKHCVSNRFFCNESLRTRIIGYQLYKFNITGFLHWGYNFYYTQLSKAVINPFEVSDAGGKFPSGDSYVVYPAPDGTAYHSIRLKVFFDALQDMAALNTLEKLTDKKTALNLIEENGRHNLTFRNYPHDNEWMLRTREAVNAAIKERI